jgi:hypothetical protein
MLELRSQYRNQFDKHELRESRYGALQFFKQESASRPIFDPETIANIQKSYGNSVVVPVLDAQTVTITTPYTRTCSIVDSENESALVTLTFASYGWGFSMTPATHYNNDVKYFTDWERKMRKYLIQYAADLDTLCIATLEADKNIYWPAGGPTSFYSQTGDALQVAQADKNDFYNQLDAIMQVMDFYDAINVVANPHHTPLVRRLSNQGAANDENEAFQFALRGYTWFPTNRITNGGGVESTGYSVQLGTCYIGNRNDADTVMGGSIGGNQKVWSQENMPIVNLLMGSYYQQDCGDRSAMAGPATAGNTRSRYEGFEFSTDIVVATTYNSAIASRYQPILKFEITTT